MNDLIYVRDRTLSLITLLLGIVIWAAVLYGIMRLGGTKGLAGAAIVVLLMIAVGSLGYLFIMSAFLSHLRGNSIEVTDSQLPDLHQQLLECCDKIPLKKSRPRMFIQNGNGVLNAFATWFLGSRYVILLSDVVEAMEENANGVRFYIGHELGHIQNHDNPFVAALRLPALWLPLLGAGFSRARESTCDLHGLACSQSRDTAALSLVALMAGKRRWKAASMQGLADQAQLSGRFWMSFHELIASYPWTVKRVLRIGQEQPAIPRRNPFAYVLALFVPYAGRMGSGFGVLLYVYVIGILAAIAIPAYQDYTVRAELMGAIPASEPARNALARYYVEHKAVPASLAAVDVDPTSIQGYSMSVDSKGMVLALESRHGVLLFVPTQDRDGSIYWRCQAGEKLKPSQLPLECR